MGMVPVHRVCDQNNCLTHQDNCVSLHIKENLVWKDMGRETARGKLPMAIVALVTMFLHVEIK